MTGIFRRLIGAALCAGVLCGVFAAVAHQFGTVPLILQAETYERAAASSPAHAEHEDQGWMPENGLQRTAATLAADLLAAIGFALLLAAGLALRGGEAGWHQGLFWGLAGFAAFTLAPGLGLPPEIPGAAVAPLAERQLWWLATALATGSGLALFAFARQPRYALLAALLIVLPHLYGAPHPAEAAEAAPAVLAQRFVVAVTLVSFLFWTALGAATGYFYRRFAPR